MKYASTLADAQEDMTKNLDCADNIRIADISKPNEVAHYLTARDHGCCGSEDRLVYCQDKLYLMGCNYGH